MTKSQGLPVRPALGDDFSPSTVPIVLSSVQRKITALCQVDVGTRRDGNRLESDDLACTDIVGPPEAPDR